LIDLDISVESPYLPGRGTGQTMNSVVSDGERGHVSSRSLGIALVAALALSAVSLSGCATGAYNLSADYGTPSAVKRLALAEFKDRGDDPEQTPELFGADDERHGKTVLLIWPVFGEPTGVSIGFLSSYFDDLPMLGADVLVGCGWNGGPSLHTSMDLLIAGRMSGNEWYIFGGPGVRCRTRNGTVAELGPRALFGVSFFVLTGSIAPGYDFKSMKPTIDFDVGLALPF
jgi:hypothetical protein